MEYPTFFKNSVRVDAVFQTYKQSQDISVRSCGHGAFASLWVEKYTIYQDTEAEALPAPTVSFPCGSKYIHTFCPCLRLRVYSQIDSSSSSSPDRCHAKIDWPFFRRVLFSSCVYAEGRSDGRRCPLFGGSLPNDTAGGIWRGERGKSPFVIPLRCTNDTKVGYELVFSLRRLFAKDSTILLSLYILFP